MSPRRPEKHTQTDQQDLKIGLGIEDPQKLVYMYIFVYLLLYAFLSIHYFSLLYPTITHTLYIT